MTWVAPGPGSDPDAEPHTGADGAPDGASHAQPSVRHVRPRSELEIRWRQARNAPPPVVRAVLANLAVAGVGGIILLLFDWLTGRGAVQGGDVIGVAPILYVAVVIISGSLLTYLWVELPTGVAGEPRRSPWAAVLGFFASIPIVYLSLVVIFQVLRPLLP